MSQLFICHATKNKEYALALAQWLTNEGWSGIFLDSSLEHGVTTSEKWREAIDKELRRSHAVILLLSEQWLESDECKRELDIAVYAKKILFVILLDELNSSQIPVDLSPVQLIKEYEFSKDKLNNQTFTVTLDNGILHKVTLANQTLQRLYKGLESQGLASQTFNIDATKPIYKGLLPYLIEDAGVFFGRESDIQAYLLRLDTLSLQPHPRFLPIIGSSGSGKSSFMRAGILSHLQHSKIRYKPLPVIRPSQAVLTGSDGLIKALSHEGENIDVDKNKLSDILMEDDDFDNKILDLLKQIAQSAQLPDTQQPPMQIEI